MKKKVLIIGNSIKEGAIAEYFSQRNYDVCIAPGNTILEKKFTCIDIRANDEKTLLEYSLENGVDLVIPASDTAISSSLDNLFRNNGISTFTPPQNTLDLFYNKPFAKKLLYKLGISTPKFGVFEKNNPAFDYVKNLKSPFVIKTNDASSALVLTSPKMAKKIIDSLLYEKQQKIIIEDYITGTPFSFYTVTDGYKALPIGSAILYKHALEGDGGQLTSGMGACVPNYKMSLKNEKYLMNNVIYPTLRYFEKTEEPCLGILGVNGIITTSGDIYVLGYLPFMQDCDCTAILNNIDEDLFSLFNSCIIGAFSDEFEQINTLNKSSVSVVLNCTKRNTGENVIHGIEELDENTQIAFYPRVSENKYLEYVPSFGENMLLTTSSATITKAKQKMLQEIKCINFDGLTYRKDICALLN